MIVMVIRPTTMKVWRRPWKGVQHLVHIGVLEGGQVEETSGGWRTKVKKSDQTIAKEFHLVLDQYTYNTHTCSNEFHVQAFAWELQHLSGKQATTTPSSGCLQVQNISLIFESSLVSPRVRLLPRSVHPRTVRND